MSYRGCILRTTVGPLKQVARLMRLDIAPGGLGLPSFLPAIPSGWLARRANPSIAQSCRCQPPQRSRRWPTYEEVRLKTRLCERWNQRELIGRGSNEDERARVREHGRGN